MNVKRLRQWLDELPDDLEVVVREGSIRAYDIDDLILVRKGGASIDCALVKAIISINDEITVRPYRD